MREFNILIDRIKKHEGFEGMPYKDKYGYLTIAYGTKLPLTEEEGVLLLRYRLNKLFQSLINRKPFIVDLPDEIQGVLAEMAYQMGVDGLLGFKNMWEALENEDYCKVVEEMLDSKWAKKDSPSRAKELAEIVRSYC